MRYLNSDHSGGRENHQIPFLLTVDVNVDGKVDIEDLKVFMTYYEKENPPAQP